MLNKEKICQIGQQVIATEIEALQGLKQRIGDGFVKACEYLLNCQGRIVVIGMGKSGHIGSKLAATLASTGSPAFFVHPADASHGDIGMIKQDDVLIIISNSGNTPEILAILPAIKYLNVPILSLTGNPDSLLAKEATVNLDVSVVREAGSFSLVPTASTTVTLAMGDALAITLLEMRGFTAEDFARSHPGGVLGKRLLLRIENLMRIKSAIPQVKIGTLLAQALVEVTQKRIGFTTVVDAAGKLIGIFTDGDLRRVLDKGLDIHNTKIEEVMTKKCKTVARDILAFDALCMMEQYGITSLVVIDDNHFPVGAIHMHDLLKAGLA